MAGDTLNRPLFQHREHAKVGGLKSFYNWLRGYGKQGEFFKYEPNTPITYVDDLGETKTLNTQTITPNKRYDVETNIYGQAIDDNFYKYQKPKNVPPPIINRTEATETVDLFGNTIKQPATTTINWKNLYNQPFTNFGTIRQRWSSMPKDQRKKIIRNVLATGTAYTMLPDWMKDTAAAQEVKKETDQKEITSTLEEQGLPTPALSYEEATTFGPEGDPSVTMAGMEEYAEISDKEINEKKKQLKEESEILNPEPVDPGGRMEEFSDLSRRSLPVESGDDGGGQATMFDLIDAYLGTDTEVDAKGIEETKAELKSLMGDDDSKMMNTMMLMQLGLSLMSGETRKSGLAGFMDVAGTAGKEILPMAMQNLQNN